MNRKEIKLSLLLIILLSFRISSAQTIIPLQPLTELDFDYIEENDVYVKDVDNKLGKFVGTWIGSFKNREYELKIDKFTDNKNLFPYKIDILVMRYRIVNSNSREEIINTTQLENENVLVVHGLDLRGNNTYVLDYAGRLFKCGQNGIIFLDIRPDETTMAMSYEPAREFIDPAECPNGVVQVLPTEGSITLTKQ